MKSNPQTAASIYIETFNDTATVLVPANTPLPTVWQALNNGTYYSDHLRSNDRTAAGHSTAGLKAVILSA